MSLRLYTVAQYLMLPWLLLYLCWRGFRNAAYYRHWNQRFGFTPRLPRGQRSVWIHAVSVGEVQAALPLVRKLRLRYPDAQLLVTTTTPTGAARVRHALDHNVSHSYVPYDVPSAAHRFLDRAHPDLAIIMETELWPNLFTSCKRRSIPVLVANARLSERSLHRYQKISRLARTMLSSVSAIAAQTVADAERFVALGTPPSKVTITGSIKFDIDLPLGLLSDAQAMRGQWGVQRPVWIAASTHENEDEQILDAFAQVLRAKSDTLLVLVPRHPERFARVAALCRRHGYTTALRSQRRDADALDVFIGDSMGELLLFYGTADVAFVGGSLVPVGGHNPLEPAALGVPIVMGPHVFNFAEISTRLCAAGAAQIVHNAKELAEVVIELLQNRERCQSMGQRGKRFVQQNRGALERLLTLVDALLPEHPSRSGNRSSCTAQGL
ncbi:MAG: lipid IV(A) 3-deoxy-D-manno-octulosonic acid transferase [Gammaproteobacteria bacterium]